MTIQTLILLALQVSIFLTVLTVGMGTSGADLRYVFSTPSQLVRSLLAMNVLGPVAAIMVCKVFSLHPAVIVALVTLAIAPVSALFPHAMLPLVAPGRAAYAHGLFFASGDVHVNPLAVAQVVVGSVLLPLGIGLGIGRWRPAARRWIPPYRR
jgi:BASS family bile acid:Na+ symporter